jgi:putative membrane protein
MYRTPYWNGWGVGSVIFMIIVTVLLIALVVLAAMWFRNGSSRQTGQAAPPAPVPQGYGTPPNPTERAKAILDERLARGEIDVQEYQARLQALQQHPGS